jgi:hypothetical protein
MKRLSIPFVLLLLLVGCGGADAGGEGPSASAEGWPSELISGPGTGPALYLSSDVDAPAVGYVSGGVRMRITGEPVEDRMPVRIGEPLKVRAWLDMSRLAARVQKRGRIGGTPTYVGPGNLVGVRGRDDEGNLRVEVAPWFGTLVPNVSPFEGVYPASRLGPDEPSPDAQGPTAGEPHRLPAGEQVPLYDRPNGEVIMNLPATAPPVFVEVLRERGEWKGVRVGQGPYLIGYVNAALEPTEQPPASSPDDGTPAPGPVPQRLAAEGERPLWRVRTGARLRFNRRTIAIFAEPGLAREMNRYETGEVDVFAAVNEDVALRGMLRTRDLEPYEGDGGEAAPDAQPEQPNPTESTDTGLE